MNENTPECRCSGYLHAVFPRCQAGLPVPSHCSHFHHHCPQAFAADQPFLSASPTDPKGPCWLLCHASPSQPMQPSLDRVASLKFSPRGITSSSDYCCTGPYEPIGARAAPEARLSVPEYCRESPEHCREPPEHCRVPPEGCRDPPETYRVYPNTVGSNPNTVGSNPNIVGNHPNIVGYHPKDVGIHPKDVGIHPKPIGFGPESGYTNGPP